MGALIYTVCCMVLGICWASFRHGVSAKAAKLMAFALCMGGVLWSVSLPISRLDPRYAPKQEYGLLEIPVPKRGHLRPGVDIVFVHGLGANLESTWGRVETSSGSSTWSSPNWISELLAADLPEDLIDSTRIFLYHYNSYWKRDAVATRLSRMADDLRADLDRLVRKHQSRHLLFVTASYGGLLVKKGRALVDAELNREPMSERTSRVIFLGCPHRGSSLARLGIGYSYLYGFFGARSSLLHGLEYDSLDLLDLHTAYVSVAKRHDIRATNVYEKLPIRVLGFPGPTVVNEQSAVFDGSDTVGVDADHYGLNKFSTRTHPYQVVYGRIEAALVEAIKASHLTKHWHHLIPVNKAKSFVERPQLMEELRQKGNTAYTETQSSQIVAVVGYGGCGKTQLVRRFVEESASDYDAVVWLDASSEERLLASFDRVSDDLKLQGQSEPPLIQSPRLSDFSAVRKTLAWLRSPDRRWLVVLDGVDETFEDLITVLPRGPSGTLVITSRDRKVVELFDAEVPIVYVDRMQSSEAASLLARGLRTEGKLLDEDLVTSITEALEMMPLALDIAASLIRATIEDLGFDPNRAMADFLRRFNRDRTRLLEQKDPLEDFRPYKLTVQTVWNATLSAIETKHGKDPLQFLAFLGVVSQGHVSDELWETASYDFSGTTREDDAPRWLRAILDVNDGATNLNALRAPLLRYCLLQRSSIQKRPGTTVHGLIHWRSLSGQNVTFLQEWRSRILGSAAVMALGVVEKGFFVVGKTTYRLPADETASGLSGLTATRFLKSLAAFIPAAEDLTSNSVYSWNYTQSVTRMARVCTFAKQYSKAEALFRHVLHLEQAYASQHDDEFAVASEEPYHEKSLVLNRFSIAEGIPLFGASTMHLVQVLFSQGRYDEALSLSMPVIEAREKVLGPNTLLTVESKAITASILAKMNRFEEAEEYARDALTYRAQIRGEKHVETIEDHHTLGLIYSWQGKHSDAKAQYDKAITAAYHSLGPAHPKTLLYISNRARALLMIGELEEAEYQVGAVLRHQRQIYDPDDPDIMQSSVILAAIYGKQGRFEEEVSIEREVLESVKARGSIDALTFDTMRRLGHALYRANNLQGAEDALAELFSLQTQHLGREDEATLDTQVGLTMLRMLRGSLTLEEALRDLQEEYGQNHRVVQLVLSRVLEGANSVESGPTG